MNNNAENNKTKGKKKKLKIEYNKIKSNYLINI